LECGAHGAAFFKTRDSRSVFRRKIETRKNTFYNQWFFQSGAVGAALQRAGPFAERLGAASGFGSPTFSKAAP
jgi:hypothetical protein